VLIASLEIMLFTFSNISNYYAWNERWNGGDVASVLLSFIITTQTKKEQIPSLENMTTTSRLSIFVYK